MKANRDEQVCKYDHQARFPRFKYVQMPGDVNLNPQPFIANMKKMSGEHGDVNRDTVKLCEGSSYRRCLLGMAWQDTDILIGRDLEPRCGLMVR